MSRHTRLTPDAVQCPDCDRIVSTWATHDCSDTMFEADDMDARTFDTDDLRVFCLNDLDIVFYDRQRDSAWLACQDAPHVADWR
jgi:hypothetical protein